MIQKSSTILKFLINFYAYKLVYVYKITFMHKSYILKGILGTIVSTTSEKFIKILYIIISCKIQWNQVLALQ